MKKFILPIIIFVLAIISIFYYSKDKNTELKKITVAEVAHSIFYAPWYAAQNLGYFEEEGLDIEMVLTPGADKVTAAVLSGDVEIGFSGSEATIYVYNKGEEDYLITFSALTKRDGSFIVSREKCDNFTLNDLVGKKIIGGRIGGMPEMTLEWILKENNINPNKDLVIDTSIAFASMGGAFIGGTGDFVSLFEPTALEIEKAGYGYVVASLGELGGVVPYTAFNAKKSYIENNPDIIKSFVKAIQKGLDFVHNSDSNEIASAITEYFPDTSLTDLSKIIDRYKKNDSWFSTTYVNEFDFNHIQDIMINAKQLNEKVPFDKLVNNDYSIK